MPDIKALAALARLEVTDEDIKKLEEQIPAILTFAARIQEVAGGMPADMNPAHKNIMRTDDYTHETGIYTEALLAAAPRREGDYIVVPQVLKGGKHA